MEFSGLCVQYERMKEELDRAVLSVLEEGQYILGPQVDKLEKSLARYTGRKHCVAVSSGTDALVLALMAEGIGPGDQVLTTPFTFFATAEAISLVGATPVFVDINPVTYNLDPYCLNQTVKRLRREIGSNPRAVISVNLYGLPADYDKIVEICKENGLLLIEDAAQSFGASCGERKSCSLGDYSTTSFFPAKPLGCYGDGGAVFCDTDERGALLRSLRVHGQGSHKYENLRIGLNARLDEMQAAVLNVKLAYFDEEIAARRRSAAAYTEMLRDVVKTPVEFDTLTNVYAQYTIALKDANQRDLLQEGLKARGIPCNVYYATPLHRQPAYSKLTYHAMPNADDAANRVLSLPMHAYLQKWEIEQVCSSVRDILSSLGH